MDKEKLEKMVEMMKGCCKDEGGMMDCCSMMRKMMGYGERKETEKKKKDAGEKE
jgi:peroxiredoxin family protein